jgi:hypothetical protein
MCGQGSRRSDTPRGSGVETPSSFGCVKKTKNPPKWRGFVTFETLFARRRRRCRFRLYRALRLIGV